MRMWESFWEVLKLREDNIENEKGQLAALSDLLGGGAAGGTAAADPLSGLLGGGMSS